MGPFSGFLPITQVADQTHALPVGDSEEPKERNCTRSLFGFRTEFCLGHFQKSFFLKIFEVNYFSWVIL